jgi:hypothetical protein
MSRTGRAQGGRNMKNRGLSVIAIVLFALCAICCSDVSNLFFGGAQRASGLASGGSTTSDTPFGLPEVSGVVGAAQGTVSDPRGAVLNVPAGALDSSTTVSITTFANQAEVTKGSFGAAPIAACADFRPDGTVFKTPATVTLPFYGDPSTAAVSLFFWNGPKSRWEPIGPATLSADGKSLSGQVSHFCTIAGFPYGGGLLEQFKTLFGDGSAAQASLDEYATWFKQQTGIMDKKLVVSNQCYKCASLYFNVNYSIDTVSASVNNHSGADATSVNPRYPFSNWGMYWDYQSATTGGGQTVEKQIIIDIGITAYLEPEQPGLTIETDSDTIAQGGSAKVTSFLTANGFGLFGKALVFKLSGVDATLSDDTGSTDKSGEQQAVIKPGVTDGEVTVSVKYSELVDGVPIEATASKTLKIAVVGVTDVQPADLAVGVDPATKIQLTFSKQMDPASLNAAFSLSPAVGGTGSLDATGKIYTWTPSASLGSKTQYTLIVSTAAKDADGTALAGAFTSSFTTASPGSSNISFTYNSGGGAGTDAKYTKGFGKITEPSAYYNETAQTMTILAYGDSASSSISLTLNKQPVVNTTYSTSDCGSSYVLADGILNTWYITRNESTDTTTCTADNQCTPVCTTDPYDCPLDCTMIYNVCKMGAFSISLTFTKVGAVGETVEGTFSMTLPQRDYRQSMMTITNGKFAVKRVAASVW